MVSRECCIEKLEQFILDENRIVTYKLLSQELKMHVNIAKQYLADFFAIQKSKNVSLQVTYFLAGIIEKDGERSMKVLVVSDRNLEQTKEIFSEVTSCHIYSISKNKLDGCSILITERPCNNNIGEINKYSAIKHPAIQTKPPILKKISQLNNDAKSSAPKKQETNSAKNGSSSFFQKTSNSNQTEKKKSVENVKTENTPETKVLKKESPEKSKSDPKNQKSNPLASMWQKKEVKSKDNKIENSKPEVKSKTKSPAGSGKNAVAKSNNILSMFSKQAAKNSENPKKETVTPVCKKEVEKVTPKEKSEDTPVVSQNSKESKNKKTSKSASTKRKSNNRQSKMSSKQKSDNESEDEIEPKKKKHRRICTFEDSDSESENEEAQDKAQRSLLDIEDPLESAEQKISPMLLSDDEEPIPPTPVPTKKGKKKVWKTVQKTFQDEDGFFVTKQQKELVSASDSDEEDPKPNKTSKDNVKSNNFTYRKQSSLTSFFK